MSVHRFCDFVGRVPRHTVIAADHHGNRNCTRSQPYSLTVTGGKRNEIKALH